MFVTKTDQETYERGERYAAEYDIPVKDALIRHCYLSEDEAESLIVDATAWTEGLAIGASSVLGMVLILTILTGAMKVLDWVILKIFCLFT